MTELSVCDCDFLTLLALEDQMPRERFEQIKVERPDFAQWLEQRRPKSTLTLVR
jgi:hypothetical protein